MTDVFLILIQVMLAWYAANAALFFLHEWLNPGLIQGLKELPEFEDGTWTAVLLLIHFYILTVAAAKLHAFLTKKS